MFWRLHKAIFQERIDEASQLIESMGDRVQVVEGGPSQLAPLSEVSLKEPSLAITTLQDARRLLREEYPSTPWLFFDAKRYDVSSWSSQISPDIHWLNRKGIFIPYGSLLNMDKSILDCLTGEDNKIFIRPDSGNKVFTGFCVTNNDTFREEIQRNLLTNIPDPQTMCYLAGNKNINPIEWRFWICEKKIVAHTPYSWDEDPALSEPPHAIMSQAIAMAASSWQPDYSYVADFCLDKNNNSHLIEINASSTSGIYQVDLNLLLPALKNTCIREWEGIIED